MWREDELFSKLYRCFFFISPLWAASLSFMITMFFTLNQHLVSKYTGRAPFEPEQNALERSASLVLILILINLTKTTHHNHIKHQPSPPGHPGNPNKPGKPGYPNNPGNPGKPGKLDNPVILVILANLVILVILVIQVNLVIPVIMAILVIVAIVAILVTLFMSWIRGSAAILSIGRGMKGGDDSWSVGTLGQFNFFFHVHFSDFTFTFSLSPYMFSLFYHGHHSHQYPHLPSEKSLGVSSLIRITFNSQVSQSVSYSQTSLLENLVLLKQHPSILSTSFASLFLIF